MKKLVNIHKLSMVICIIVVSVQTMKAQEQKVFSSINEVLELAKSKNLQFKNATLQTELASIAHKTAIVNIVNPKIPTSIQILDNINQQVSFLPGQAFGQPQGTFKEVTIGQQYVATFSIQPQFDILNLGNIAQIKSAKTNKLLVENQNKINEQILYEKINKIYFNILAFNEQKEIVLENIKIANEITRTIQNKYNEGITRKQDVNEAQVNAISLQDKLEQIEINLEIQHKALNVILNDNLEIKLIENLSKYDGIIEKQRVNNKIIEENARLQKEIAKQDYQFSKFQNLPVLSFVSSFNWQNLSNESSFSENSNWIRFNYVGLRLSYDFPTTVLKYSILKAKKTQSEIAKNNEIASIKENENRNSEMILEFEKAVKQKNNFSKIFQLKKDTYEKNFNQFKENILPLDKLLISQNDLLSSKLNLVATWTNIGYYLTKIEINNKI